MLENLESKAELFQSEGKVASSHPFIVLVSARIFV